MSSEKCRWGMAMLVLAVAPIGGVGCSSILGFDREYWENVCGDGRVAEEFGEECDDGNTVDGDRCSPACALQDVSMVAAGGSVHACALLRDGKVKCWGSNNYGQLGLGDTNNRGDQPGEMGDNLPSVDLGTGITATAIASGSYHTCALLKSGTVKCWGLNNYGQLGLGDGNDRGDQPGEKGDNLPPVDLGTGMTATAIASGDYHTCAILNDGTIKCWGYNDHGQLGRGDTSYQGDQPGEMGDNLPPINLGVGIIATALAAGSYHTCAIVNGGTVKCWGLNNYGQLGLGDTNNRGDQSFEMGDSLPLVPLGVGVTATAIAAGGSHTCVILDSGSVKCWGQNNNGQLGLGDINNRGSQPNEMGENLPPVNLGINIMATSISAGGAHSCAIIYAGSLKCWGNNYYGKLGLGDTDDRGDQPGEMGGNLPLVNLGPGTTAKLIASGYLHTCALLSSGASKCWGYNNDGQLGLGDTDDRGDQSSEMGDNLPTVKLFSDLW